MGERMDLFVSTDADTDTDTVEMEDGRWKMEDGRWKMEVRG